MIKKKYVPAFFMLFMILLAACSHRDVRARVLVFTKAEGYRHSSIDTATRAIILLGQQHNFDVDTTSDASHIQEDSLQKYSAVIFLSTTGKLLNRYEKADFERYIEAGGGYVGVHAATDAEYNWEWYGKLAGGYFNGHPEQQEAIINVVDSANPSTSFLPRAWKRKDEWYNFKNLGKDIHVLLTIDEKSYKGGTNGDYHPMAWYHEFDGGRAWYTELGHTGASYSDTLYLRHLLGGIEYAIGENHTLNYSKATALRVPEENRFRKTMLVEGELYEPTEMTVLPNLDVFIVQRRGEMLLYRHDTKKLKRVALLPVYFKSLKGSTEEGLLGVQADPDFASNHFIYVYYAATDTAADRLSRFTLDGDTVDLKSEKKILQVTVDRDMCCHTGGSVAFGKDHNLFVSTGDNSTPFDEHDGKYRLHAFAPLDDRPGYFPFDARRSAGNTNDLRGKIIRVKINPDGSYSIPEGNLFAPGTPKARPEIYVMGNRNPYRISVDKETGFVYWGEVGPDANNDSFETRGPRGYDEVNQARKAGNFGWPYFAGHNYPYREYDFNTGVSGVAFDPQHPLNHSRNNTGLVELPPAQPAFIWYPYGPSPDFPDVGSGGRTAMAGPVYHKDFYPEETRYPDYYNNKFFIYDWIRGWIKLVTMKPDGSFAGMEPFMENTKLNSLIDMEAGPDGKLYFLEYGNGWYSKNADAGLSVIDYYPGNRPPTLATVHATARDGLLPFQVKVSAEASDPENDPLTYTWNFGNGSTITTKVPEADFTYTTAGDFTVAVTAKDDKGLSSATKTITLYAGNKTPVVTVALKSSNKSFYFPGKPVEYTVLVDGGKTMIDTSGLYVSTSFSGSGDKGEDIRSGKILTQSLDCKSCHKESEKSIGPSFMQIAGKYNKDKDGQVGLADKVMKGGAGVWGDVAMPAHPGLLKTDFDKIMRYINGLTVANNIEKSLPPTGILTPPKNAGAAQQLIVSATYSAIGKGNVKALSGKGMASLRGGDIIPAANHRMQGFNYINTDGKKYFRYADDKQGWIALDSVDLTGVAMIDIIGSRGENQCAGFEVELRLDSVAGKLLAKGHITLKPGKLNPPVTMHAGIKSVTDGRFHNVYIVAGASQPKCDFHIEGIRFNSNE